MPRTRSLRRRKAKKQQSHWFFRWPTLLVILVAMVFMGRGVVDMVFKYTRAVAATETAQKEYEELQERKTELEERIEYLNTNTGFEAELRSKYSVSREGEQIVQLVGEEEESQEQKVEEVEKKGLVEKIIEFFTGEKDQNL